MILLYGIYRLVGEIGFNKVKKYIIIKCDKYWEEKNGFSRRK